jgi:hypothetical protein
VSIVGILLSQVPPLEKFEGRARMEWMTREVAHHFISGLHRGRALEGRFVDVELLWLCPDFTNEAVSEGVSDVLVFDSINAKNLVEEFEDDRGDDPLTLHILVKENTDVVLGPVAN